MISFADHTRTLDLADVELLFVQDEVGLRYGEWPHGIKQTEFRRMTDMQLSKLVRNCRNAVLLPLSDNFLRGISEILYEAELEARKRLVHPKSDEWASADLINEVTSAGVQLVKRGREWWGLCPFHNERTASLAVNPEKRTWHCHGCGKAGGVYQWRKEVKDARGGAG